MAPSSSANKVAKLASRGRGKRVRFQSGTTFPVALAIIGIVMLALITYAKASMPSANEGPPAIGDEWTASYALRICDTEYALTGRAGDEQKSAATGAPDKLKVGQSSADFMIHYHPVDGKASGRNARLGVFLGTYDVKLSNTKLEIPSDQTVGGKKVYDLSDDKIFEGTSCDGKKPKLIVRVWDDYTRDNFVDNVTAFDSLRLKNNGMVFVIAVVPDGDSSVPRPANFCQLETYGAIGNGTDCGTASTSTTVAGSTDTTVAGSTDTTVPGSTDTVAPAATTTTDSTAPVTTGA